jgi:hypothetical protein
MKGAERLIRRVTSSIFHRDKVTTKNAVKSTAHISSKNPVVRATAHFSSHRGKVSRFPGSRFRAIRDLPAGHPIFARMS